MCFKLTVDKSKAVPGQTVLVQIPVPGPSALLFLKFPPAQHSSTQHQIVTVGGAAQLLFSLKGTERRVCVTISIKK